ncbi:DUF551 domain-containing protein [Escherichia coli]|uniref:DUF551 domain-containing protein n=1 Tax=Escherichia coli TaxID=562 RepID=UPI003EBD7F74
MITITKERLLTIKQWRETYGPGSKVVLPAEEAEELARIALVSLDEEPVAVNDDMAYAFHHALSDSSLGADEVEEIKTGLRAAFSNVTAQPAPVVPDEIEPDDGNTFDYVDGWNACRAAMLHGAEPVSQTYNLPELIEGMEVSIDVSTCDADLGNRYFGTVTEALELDTAKNGYILLVQDAEPNFDVNGNSPGTPDGWISCSERMPNDAQWCVVNTEYGYYVQCWSEGQGWLGDDTSIPECDVINWMPLPEPPQEVNP